MTTPIPLDAAAIAHHFGVSVSAIRMRAHREFWTPYGTKKHRLWDLRQARASFERKQVS
jgi:Zn-dependent peptidase ImmA (M78 family)